MGEPKITVIMPVYNVEAYVGKAIESVIAQTLPEWEMFCVDDGSTDNSGAVLDAYAARDPRINVIHKENGGAHSARNLAIDRAAGEYLYFMDADDWAEPEMLRGMYAAAKESDAQLVVASFYIDTYYSDTEYYEQLRRDTDAFYPDAASFRAHAHVLFDMNLLYPPWNKLYRADYIKDNGLYFPNMLWDDFPFNIAVVKDIERVRVLDKGYYHFLRKRAESETAKYVPSMYEKRETEQTWMEQLYAYWGVDTPESREFLARRYIERAVGCVENLANGACTLSLNERRAAIKTMISSERARNALKIARPKSAYMKLMLVPFKMKNVTLVYLEGKCVSFVKSRDTKLFARLKARR